MGCTKIRKDATERRNTISFNIMNSFGKRCFIVLLLAIASGVTSQDTLQGTQGMSHSLNGGKDEFHPPEDTKILPEGRQESNSDGPQPIATPTMQTISFVDTVKNSVLSRDTDPVVPLDSESGKGENNTPQALVSLVFIAAVVALCVVGCVAFVGGMFCWYKHADITSSARRVLYRSSDSSVLIHNGYQPMGDRHETGSPATNNNMSRLAEKSDYPAYGVTGPNPMHNSNKGPPIDMNLNRSAEVYHYQQQKQRLKKLNSSSSNGGSNSRSNTNETLNQTGSPGGGSENPHEDDEENSDGEYTVYECPGLASTSDGPMEIHNPLFADSDSGFSSYSTTPLGGGIVTSTHDYSTTVGGQG